MRRPATLPLVNEDGWAGSFTRNQAPGAIPNGHTIVKIAEDPGDLTPIGTCGVVLGSLRAGSLVGYFVEWSNRPFVAVFVAGPKIEETEAP